MHSLKSLITTAVIALTLAWSVPASANLRKFDRNKVNSHPALSAQSRHAVLHAEALGQTPPSRDPENIAELALFAGASLQQPDRDEAMASLLRALSANPKSVEVNDALGNLLLERHHAPEAMDRFETVLTFSPSDKEARRGEFAATRELALSARNSGHPEIALEVLQHARTKLPDDPQLLIALGNQASDLHLLREAENAFTAARSLTPNDPDLLYALGQLETEQQRLPAAEADLSAYLRLQPKDATAHFGLGHVFAMEERKSEARAEFERCIELQPLQTEAYYQIGQIELNEHHDSKAEALFRKTLERDSTHGGALTGMGVLAFRGKDYARAEQYLAAAEKTAPGYGPAHYYRGLSLARMNRNAEADAELHTATELGKAKTGAAQSGTLDAPGKLPNP